MAEDPNDDTAKRHAALTRRWSRGFLGFAVVSVAFVGLHRVRESDVFWHLNQGRAVLRHATRVVPEPSAFPELVRVTKVAAWLWDVATYLCYRGVGFAGLAWFTAAIGLLAALAVLFMLRAVRPTGPDAARVLVAGLTLACMTSRVRARPEIVALLAAPLLIGVLFAFRRADDARVRVRFGLAATVIGVLWAQLHGSFLLVPAIGAAILAPALLRSSSQQQRTAVLLLALMLLLTSLTSTSGIHLVSYGLEHSAVDIKLHDAEMHAPIWRSFDPTSSVFGPIYLLLVGLSLFGLGFLGRATMSELLLSLLGALVVGQSVRFFALGAILTAPLALQVSSERMRGVPRRHAILLLLTCSMISAFVLHRVLARAQESIGPLGTLGLAESELPLASARYLSRLPEGSRALTTYDAGGSLGFFLDGRVRTFVDSRTMVLFDDTQFALSRDVFRSPQVLERAASRYRASAIVLRRSDPICNALRAPWTPVVVEASWTTFVNLPNALGLTTLTACGEQWLRPDACAGNAQHLEQEVRRVHMLRASPLDGFLEATRAVSCKNDPAQGARRLPDRAHSEGFVAARDRLAARIAFASHRPLEGLAAVAQWAAGGDVESWAMLRHAVHLGELPSSKLLPLARRAVALLDDHTPPDLREVLAMLCIDAGDTSCARFHGLRAAVAGSPHARTLLLWLATQHPDLAVREDAAAWLEVISRRN